MRKIKSREYCHDCQKYSDWLFEEREGNQIIECPLCGHMHYRVIQGSIIDFEIEFRGEKITNMNRVRELLNEFPETKDELEAMFATLEFGSLEDAKKLVVSGQRWGQDLRQLGYGNSWSVGSSTTTTWGNYAVTSDSTNGTGSIGYNTWVYAVTAC